MASAPLPWCLRVCSFSFTLRVPWWPHSPSTLINPALRPSLFPHLSSVNERQAKPRTSHQPRKAFPKIRDRDKANHRSLLLSSPPILLARTFFQNSSVCLLPSKLAQPCPCLAQVLSLHRNYIFVSTVHLHRIFYTLALLDVLSDAHTL